MLDYEGAEIGLATGLGHSGLSSGTPRARIVTERPQEDCPARSSFLSLSTMEDDSGTVTVQASGLLWREFRENG
jgi:hypothetical protein